MLTKFEMKLLAIALKISCSFGLFPLDFDSSNFRVHPTTSKWKRPILKIRTVMSFIYGAFIIYRSQASVADFKSTGQVGQLAFHFMRFLAQWELCMLHAVGWIHTEEIAQLLNFMVQMNTQLGVKYFKTKYAKPNLRQYLVLMTMLSVLGTNGFAIGSYLMMPNFPGYPTTIFPPYAITFYGFFGFEAFTAMDLANSFIMLCVLEFAYTFSTTFWLRFLTETKMGRKNVFLIYRQLYIVNSLHNMSLSKLFLPTTKLVAGFMSMVTTFTLVRLRNHLDAFTYLLSTAGFVGSYIILIPASYTMSKMYTISSDLPKDLLLDDRALALCQHIRIEYLKRVKCLRVIRCAIGSPEYYMEKDAKATLVEWLISGTTNLFLTF